MIVVIDRRARDVLALIATGRRVPSRNGWHARWVEYLRDVIAEGSVARARELVAIYDGLGARPITELSPIQKIPVKVTYSK